jgi:hypothetical protein
VPFLYTAEAAPGPCARLAQYGSRGFPIRACCLVIYFNILNISRYLDI